MPDLHQQPASTDFLWGVATSAYQSEGGYNGPGEPHTNWFEAERQREVMASGRAADFWNCYEADFTSCQAMGLNAFRLGIEWSRVQPGDGAAQCSPPPFDSAALDRYADILANCRRHGMEPIVTLHHFVHPAWLGSAPWLGPAIQEPFSLFVKTAVTHINRALVEKHRLAPVRYYLTINEPNTLAVNTYLGNQFPGDATRGFANFGRALNQLLVAHVRAYNAIHDLYEANGWEPPQISLNNYSSDLYWSDKALLDLLALRERGIERGNLHTYLATKSGEFRASLKAASLPLRRGLLSFVGVLAKRYFESAGKHLFTAAHFAPLLDAIQTSPRSRLLDFIALDYYDPFMAHSFRFPMLRDHEFKTKTFGAWMEACFVSKWWDWRVLPRGMHFFCGYYSRDFQGRAVLIAENGMALRRRPDNRHTHRRDRCTRSRFLQLHVHEAVEIVNAGIPLIGYLHWSLFDNYEWGSFTPRFGLFSLDYTRSTGRMVEDHLGDRPSETYARLVRIAEEKVRQIPRPQRHMKSSYPSLEE